jgi:putative peptidoglycan lipid II flippase
VDWVALRSQPGLRLGLLAAVMAACAVIYLGLLAVLGLRPRALMGR